jgi:hypothetical protein
MAPSDKPAPKPKPVAHDSPTEVLPAYQSPEKNLSGQTTVKTPLPGPRVKPKSPTP